MSKNESPLSFKLPDSLGDKLANVVELETEKGSFLAAAEDLAGCLEANPGLSTADLEGYGS